MLTLASAPLPSRHVAVLAAWPLGTVSMSSFPVLATAGFHQLSLDSRDPSWAVGLGRGRGLRSVAAIRIWVSWH